MNSNDSSSMTLFSNRRSFVRKLGLAGAVLGAANPHAEGQTTAPSDADILNFALNLEYLEAEFYTVATTGRTLEQSGMAVSGAGTAGMTMGGAAVAFSDSVTRAVAMELAKDEQAHVTLIRTALAGMGMQPVAKPAINLAALGIGFGSQAEFLTLARVFEDVGVSAYGGAAPLLQSKTILGVAARILAAEAYHAGNIRLQVARNTLPSMAVDGVDITPPPTGSRYFATDNMGLTPTRTPGQVLFLLYAAADTARGGFFPNGVNGAIVRSSASADGGGTGGTGGATLTANPNPIPVTGFDAGATTITWNAPSAQTIEVRVGTRTGGLLTRFGSSGSMQTGPWVTDGMQFFLQDVTGGKALTAENTLATLTVRLQR